MTVEDADHIDHKFSEARHDETHQVEGVAELCCVELVIAIKEPVHTPAEAGGEAVG
jgi:hypothetical protein